MRYFVDTNIIIDFLAQRVPFNTAAEKLFVLGYLGEFELWVSSSQFTDAYYVLTHGEKRLTSADAKQTLKQLLKSLHVCGLTRGDIESALDSVWLDFEDRCLYECARGQRVQAILTRNEKDFADSSLPVFDCETLFSTLKEDQGLDYEVLQF